MTAHAIRGAKWDITSCHFKRYEDIAQKNGFHYHNLIFMLNLILQITYISGDLFLVDFVVLWRTGRSWRRRHRTRTTLWGKTLRPVSVKNFFYRNRSQVFTSKCGNSAMSPSSYVLTGGSCALCIGRTGNSCVGCTITGWDGAFGCELYPVETTTFCSGGLRDGNTWFCTKRHPSTKLIKKQCQVLRVGRRNTLNSKIPTWKLLLRGLVFPQMDFYELLTDSDWVLRKFDVNCILSCRNRVLVKSPGPSLTSWAPTCKIFLQLSIQFTAPAQKNGLHYPTIVVPPESDSVNNS